MKLFLDDIRIPSECTTYMYHRIGALNPIYLENWEIARTYKQFVEWIEYIHNTGKDLTHVSFDHDLADCFQLKESEDVDAWFDIEGNREYTGYDCAKFLKKFYENHELELPVMFVHSMNPIGLQKIIDLFKDS